MPSAHQAQRLAAAEPISISSSGESVAPRFSRSAIASPAGAPKTSPVTTPIRNRLAASRRPRTYAMSTADLLLRTEESARLADDPVGEVLEEVHGRFQQPLLAVVAALIGYSALMVGGFSRFGLGRQIVFAIFLLVLVKLVESVVTTPVRANGNLWPLIYLPSLAGFAMAAALLHVAARPFRPGRGAAPGAAT